MWRTAAHMPNSGDRIGNYEIVRPVGQGGFGTVYLANDLELNRKVALKLPRADIVSDRDSRERFEREALICADLDHPAIVRVYEAKLNIKTPYIASAYYAGPDLGTWLAAREKPVPWRHAVAFMAKLADAVQYAHDRGVIHRDLKPSNILLAFKDKTPENQDNAWVHYDLEHFEPKLTDFGMAKSILEEQVNTRSSLLIGTPLYMAPENFDGTATRAPTIAIDVYAFGCLLFELISGKTPFAGGSYLDVVDSVRRVPAPRLRESAQDIPKELDTICGICLEKEPKDRYSSAGELAVDFQNCLAGKSIAGRPPNFWQRFQTWTRQPERIWQAGMFTVAIHSVMMVWLFFASSLTFFKPSLLTELVGNNEEFSQIYADTVQIMLTVHLPMLLIGWKTQQGQGWAIWTGTIFSFIGLFPPLLLGLGVMEIFAAVYQNSPYHRLAVSALIFLLMATQLALYTAALTAHRRKTSGN